MVFSLVNGYPDVHILQNTPDCIPNMSRLNAHLNG